ncbi:MAG: hypothetical protein Q9163_000312 [Psora crenata]
MPFPITLGNKGASHSTRTKTDFSNIVKEVRRPIRADYVLEVKGPVRGDHIPSEGKLSHRLSRPFDVARYSVEYILPGGGDSRRARVREQQQGDDGDRATAKLRPGPARTVSFHQPHLDTSRASQYGEFRTLQPPRRSRALTESYSVPVAAANTYPRTMEDLYCQCGIISGQGLHSLVRREVNDILAEWTVENRVAAMHVMDLARKWGLRRSCTETIMLTDADRWRRSRRETYARASGMEFARGGGEEWIDETLKYVPRKQSMRLVRKEAVRHQRRDTADQVSQREAVIVPDMRCPVESRVKIRELPIAAQQLYAGVAGLKLEELPEQQRQKIIGDWTARYPVSDDHLMEVIEKWSLAPEPIGISSGYSGYETRRRRR